MNQNRMGRVPPSSAESQRLTDSSIEPMDIDSDPSANIESMVQGLTPDQLKLLAHKVYALLLDELRLDEERVGRHTF